MRDKDISGGCQCGAVRFRATGRPGMVMARHCDACKKRTGAAYGVAAYFHERDIEFNEEPRQTYEFRSTNSGRWLRNEFCPKCGTTVSWTLEKRPGMRAIAAGCLDADEDFEIEAHIWTGSARADTGFIDGVPAYPGAPPDTGPVSEK